VQDIAAFLAFAPGAFAAKAGYSAIGQETRESFKKPFQSARGAKSIPDHNV
jgi:hypothetical protein